MSGQGLPLLTARELIRILERIGFQRKAAISDISTLTEEKLQFLSIRAELSAEDF